MRNKHPAGKKRRILRRMLTLALLAAAGALAWNYLAPLVADQQTPRYTGFTVTRGDIATEKSFSATISVRNSQTITNTTGASSIRELYVSAGQEVKKGDKLMQLDNGTVLEAGLDGVVNELRFSTGDWLWQNVQLVQICDLTNLQVALSVDEYDVENVAAGQSCTVTIIPLNRDFETEIARVDRVSAATGQVASYTATAELTAPAEVLPGMSASVTMAGDSVTDVLTLDAAALAFDGDKNPYVLVKDGDGYAQRQVVTGLSDGMKVEIVSGLDEGEEVWAVTGTETVTSSFSLTEWYKRLAGEKIIINDMSSRDNTWSNKDRGGWSQEGGALPEGMELPEGMSPPEGMELPEGMTPPDGGDAPEATAQPQGDKVRESMTPPDGGDAPEATAQPQGDKARESMTPPDGGDAPEATAQPQGEKARESMTPPDGGDAPEATAQPQGENPWKNMTQPAGEDAAQPVSSDAPENGGQWSDRTPPEGDVPAWQGGFTQEEGGGEKPQRQGGRGQSAPEATDAADAAETDDAGAARRDTP
ncbi:MAG: HlyD family efflux transporter periplasmic adaptor subunit [Aristaeellaceae bacterium]